LDDDNDAIPIRPTTATWWSNLVAGDADGDGVGDVCDTNPPVNNDTDGDGIDDSIDNCPARSLRPTCMTPTATAWATRAIRIWTATAS
jgi:hypothetical protein